MNDKWYSVEQASEMLGLHPKTMRRYITEGKLRANKVGKQYRINGHDLSVFVEGRDMSFEPAAESFTPTVDVSAVVDITVRNKDEADRIERTLIAALNSKDVSYGESSMNVQRSAGGKLRVTLWGTGRFITAILESITALTNNEA